MTQLYKKNGAVFTPIGISLEEVEKLKEENQTPTTRNEWHNLDKNCKDLPNEGEWVEGLYLWYYKDEPHWDVFKVRWYHEIGELDEKLVRWYDSNDCWNSIDEPNYWRKITLPTNSC